MQRYVTPPADIRHWNAALRKRASNSPTISDSSEGDQDDPGTRETWKNGSLLTATAISRFGMSE